MGLGSNHYTSTLSDTNKFEQDIWTKWVVVEREANLVLEPKIYKLEYEYLNKGKTIEIPNVANVSTSPKAEQSPVNFIAPTETPQTFTIDFHEEVSFLFEDLTMAQTSYDLPGIYEKRAAYALAKKVDTEIAKLYTGFSNTDVGVAGTAITKPNMLLARTRLDEQEVPDDDRCFVFHVNETQALLSISELVNVSNVGEYQKLGMTRTGEYDRGKGYVYDFFGDPVYVTTNIQVTAGTPTYHNLYFHKDAMIIGKNIRPQTVTQYHADYLGYQLSTHEAFGVDNLRADHGVEVIT